MPDQPALSRLRAHLGAELRAVRTLSGRTQRDIADAVDDVSQPTVARAEQGRSLLTRDQARAWLDACSADADARARVLALIEAAHAEDRSWRDGDGSGHWQMVAAEREQASRRVRTYSPGLIPGLLGTARYAQDVIPLTDPTGTMDHAAAAGARVSRQQILYEPGREFLFLIEEMPLHWRPSGGTEIAQRAHLLSLATLPTVRLGVLPQDRVGDPPWHGFVIYEPAEGPPYVTTEQYHGGGVHVDPSDVAGYEALWSRLWDAALTGDEAVAYIRDLGKA